MQAAMVQTRAAKRRLRRAFDGMLNFFDDTMKTS
jgi:hypothetical protein